MIRQEAGGNNGTPMLPCSSVTRKLWLLALGAVATRVAAAVTVAVVAPDGARYLRMARLLLEGNFTEALALPPFMHPLYPLLISFGEAFTGQALLAALALSTVLGGLAVLPLYALFRNAWGERAGTIAALLYVFMPEAVMLHGEVMTEGVFMFLFFSTMALSWSALERKSWERALLAGTGAALTWMARPEGVYLIPLFLLACVLRPSRLSLLNPALFLAAAFLLAAPYLFFIRKQTGAWGVSATPHSAGVLGLLTGKTAPTGYSVTDESAAEFGEYADVKRFGRIGGPIVTLAKTTSKVLFHVLVPFLLIGLLYLRSPDFRPGPGLFLLAGAIGYFIPPVLALVAGTPFGYRYILPTFVLLLPVMAVGLLQAAAWMRHPRALPVLLSVLCLAMTVKFIRPKRGDKIALKESGLAIRAAFGPDRRILAMDRQIEFYARGEFVEFAPGATFKDVEKLAADRKIDLIALKLDHLRNVEKGMLAKLDAAFPLHGQYPANPGKKRDVVRVYRVGP